MLGTSSPHPDRGICATSSTVKPGKNCLEFPPFRRGQAVESPVDLSFDRDAVAQQQGSDGREGVPPQADRSPGVVRFDRAEDALGDLPKAGTPTDGVELAGHVRRRPASPAKLPNPAQDLFDLRHLRLRRRGRGEARARRRGRRGEGAPRCAAESWLAPKHLRDYAVYR
jgi:hypothetical protein